MSKELRLGTRIERPTTTELLWLGNRNARHATYRLTKQIACQDNTWSAFETKKTT